MTITKEQVDAWDGEVKAAYQSGYNAGAEAKLAELCEGVEMPEPTWYYGNDGHRMHRFYEPHENRKEGHDTQLFTLTQLQTAVAAAVAKKEAECDTITEMNHAQWLALENVRMLASRNANEEWAQHMLRFCASAGSAPNPLRVAKVDALAAELAKKDAEIAQWKKVHMNFVALSNEMAEEVTAERDALQHDLNAELAKKDEEYADSMAHQNNAYNQRVAERDAWKAAVDTVTEVHKLERDALAAKVVVLREALARAIDTTYSDTLQKAWIDVLEATK